MDEAKEASVAGGEADLKQEEASVEKPQGIEVPKVIVQAPLKLNILGFTMGRDVIEIVKRINKHAGKTQFEVAGIYDDNKAVWGKEYSGVKVIGPLEEAAELKGRDCEVFVNTIGGPKSFGVMEKIIVKTGIPREQFANIIHPSAEVVEGSDLGKGVVVSYNTRIGPEVTVGDHVWFGVGTSIGHDAKIGSYVHICDNVAVAGGVVVGKKCYIGLGAKVFQYMEVGPGSLVGGGAVVVKNVPDGAIMSGNPARDISRMLKEGQGLS